VTLGYLHYDVFTREALAGNQLAVFLDGRGLSTAAMQRIAREMNFSESTFILPAEGADTDARMRIFTPYVEMPMAGHPTVGSTFALAHAGVISRDRSRFVFGLNVGPTPVDLEWDDATGASALRFVWMTQASPTFGRVAERESVALTLGLDATDIADALPIREVSCGVPYWIVPLRDPAVVDRAVADGGALKRFAAAAGAELPFYLFSPETRDVPGADGPDAAVYCRMFAPGLGVLEDPATGSAAGPLGCYLVQHGLARGDGRQRVRITQGVKMARPSRLHVAVTGVPDAIADVKVGGEAVLVGQGQLFL
jgi:trans-2,3-dihydro-3-hydroxyanthranilate isomerase